MHALCNQADRWLNCCARHMSRLPEEYCWLWQAETCWWIGCCWGHLLGCSQPLQQALVHDFPSRETQPAVEFVEQRGGGCLGRHLIS